MRENAAQKARRYLTEGRLVVTQVLPDVVQATTRGDGHRWHQTFAAGTWACTCPARSANCSHLIALRLITAPDLPKDIE